MIEATCTACGTVNRVAEADVPGGAKFVMCAQCRARVTLPASDDAGHNTAAPSGAAEARGQAAALELADLPAPRRASPLGGVAAPSKPAPKSGLAAASTGTIDLGFTDLPAPKAASPAPKPAAAPAPAAFEFDDDLLGPPGAPLGGDAELPVPKQRAKPPTLSKPGEPADISDLPAPKAASKPLPPRMSSGPMPSMPTKPSAPAIPPPRPVSQPLGISDLPAPKAVAPKPPVPPAVPPVRPTAPAIADLPTPKGPPAIANLPTPKGPPAIADLPTPKGPPAIADLPTPKVAAPKPPAATELAPKGFFDDLPEPVKPGAVTPKGPASTASTDIAPKGFFDDLPEPSKGGAGKQGAKAELPAPKGFFDDLPGRVNNRSDVPAPKGFFDDPAAAPPAQGFFDDLPQPAKPAARPPTAKPALAPGPEPLDLGPALDPTLGPALGDLELGGAPLDLALDAGHSLELEAPSATSPAASGKSQFDDLDLSKPSTPPIRITTPQQRQEAEQQANEKKPAQTSRELPPVSMGRAPVDAGLLELEEPRLAPTPQLGPKKAKAPDADPQTAQRKQKRNKLVAIAAAGVLAVGAGGFVMYRRHAATVARATEVDSSVTQARKLLDVNDSKHWQRAAGAAGRAIELDATNAAALGLRAEAQYAGAIEEGTNYKGRTGNATAQLAAAGRANVTGPEILRARALQAYADRQYDVAVTKLAALAKSAPTDARLQLYLGWAQAAAMNAPAAIEAFTKASANPAFAVAALYGRGKVELADGKPDDATKDFTAVLAIAKDHVGAQVGLAAAKPASQAGSVELDLLAILQRKDLDQGDPRDVTEAWVRAGDLALAAGRGSDALERYRAALKVDAESIRALIGQATVELLDGKLDTAMETIGKALAQDKDNLDAQLVAGRIEVAQKAYPRAEERLRLISDHQPPPTTRQKSRLQMVTGDLLEGEGQDMASVAAYEQAAQLAGDQDLAPTLKAATKLAALAEKATPDQAQPLRDRAAKLLVVLDASAEQDPAIAKTLGVAYLQAGDATKAEALLRKAPADDLEAQYQLARALRQLGRTDEAVAILSKIVDADPKRTEVGLELARAYEGNDKLTEAGAVYGKLLAAQDPTVELRSRAGRFYARTGQIDQAAEQGTAILAVDPNNAAGMYLSGEGLLKAGQYENARKLFVRAAQLDRDAQYLDAQGRASEALYIANTDEAQLDAALKAYADASALDPKLFDPLVGQARLLLARNDAVKALPILTQATTLRTKDADVSLLMGIASIQVQQPGPATSWLEASRAIRPSAEAAFRLGGLYFDANKGSAAASAYNEAVTLAAADEKKGAPRPPWLVDAYHHLGEANLRVGNEAAAAAAWKRYLELGPKAGAQQDEVRHALATSLKQY